LQLWGDSFLNDAHSGIDTQAVFAQLTASSFKNQTAGYAGILALIKHGTVTLHKSGYPISLLKAAVNVDALPEPVKNFAWIIGPKPIIGKFRPGNPSGLWDYAPISSGLLVKSIGQLQYDKVETLSVSPNWRYRIDWILGSSSGSDPERKADPTKIDIPPDASKRTDALQSYLAMSSDHSSYTDKWGAGKEIVGVNTMGEIRFAFSGAIKQIQHILWWRLEAAKGNKPLQLFPLTTYSIPMNFTGDRTSDPSSAELITEPTFSGLST
jgi:hypothetical protein